MKRVTFFVGVLVFAACQTEGLDQEDAEGSGPTRGTTPIVVVTPDAGSVPDVGRVPDAQAAPDTLVPVDAMVAVDILPAPDVLNLDAMTRKERCATGDSKVYTYGWNTACADLAAWAIKNPNGPINTAIPIQRGINEDCAWAYCVAMR